MRAATRILMLVAGLSCASGCYVFVPVEDALPPPGASVRLSLEPEGVRRVRDEVGMDLEFLEGRLMASDGDSVVVSMLMTRLPGSADARLRRVFALPRAEVDDVEREELSRSRTVMLAAGVVGLLAYVVSKFDSGASGDPNLPGGGGGEQPVVVPWLSVGVGR